jgi:hypothetical protein
MEIGLYILVLCAVVNLAVAVCVSVGLRSLFGGDGRGRVLPFTDEALEDVLEEINTATGCPADPREVESGPITACDALVRCRLMLETLRR